MSKEDMARIASRYDTAMSRAMLAACGACASTVRRTPARRARRRGPRRGEIAYCMRNADSIMDCWHG
ncbi:MAG: hypothetical protein Q4B35_06525 [Slackia sp.]|nr:hypothetical protein [Slackia sp.]